MHLHELQGQLSSSRNYSKICAHILVLGLMTILEFHAWLHCFDSIVMRCDSTIYSFLYTACMACRLSQNSCKSLLVNYAVFTLTVTYNRYL